MPLPNLGICAANLTIYCQAVTLLKNFRCVVRKTTNSLKGKKAFVAEGGSGIGKTIVFELTDMSEDVARSVVYLAGDTNGFITGAALFINSGVYMALLRTTTPLRSSPPVNFAVVR